MCYDRDGMMALLRDVRRVVGSEGRTAARAVQKKTTERPAQQRWFDGVNDSGDTAR
jgi:hypothetical protein